jgi:hypothetical protein
MMLLKDGPGAERCVYQIYLTFRDDIPYILRSFPWEACVGISL